MTDVQARPDELESFHSTQVTAANQLETDRDTLDNSFIAFRNAPGGGCAAQGDAVVGQAMTSLDRPSFARSRLGQAGPRRPARRRPHHRQRPRVGQRCRLQLGAAEPRRRTQHQHHRPGRFQPDHRHAAPGRHRPAGLRLRQRPGVHGDRTPARRLPRLRHAGAARRAVVPPDLRLAVDAAVAFGPGWWTWTECRAEIDAAGSFQYFGPDALQFDDATTADERRWFRPDLDLDVERSDASTLTAALGTAFAQSEPALDVPRRPARRGRRPVHRHDVVAPSRRPPDPSRPRQRALADAALEGRPRRRDQLVRRARRIVHLQPRRRARRRRQRAVAGDLRRRRRRPNPVDHRRRRRPHGGDDLRRRGSGRRADLGDRVHDPLRLRRSSPHDAVRPRLQPAVGVHPRRARSCRDVRHRRRVPLHPPLRRTRSRRQPARPRRTQLRPRRFDGRVGSPSRRCAGRAATSSATTTTTSTASSGRRQRPRRRRSTTTATRCSRRGSRSPASRDSPSISTGSTARRLASPTPTASSTCSTSAPTARSPRRRTASGRQRATTSTRRRRRRRAPPRRPRRRATSATTPAGCRPLSTPPDNAARSATRRPAASSRASIPTAPSPSVEYDAAGLPSRLVAADGIATDLLFDDQQRIVGARFANGDTIGLELDEFGRQVAVDIDDDRWVTARDPAGRIVKRTDPTGDEVAQEYGDLGGWMKITDAAGQSWRLERDLVNRVRTLTTPGGRQYTAAFSPEGLLTSQTTPDGREESYTYTPAGRLAEVHRWIVDGALPLRRRRTHRRRQHRHRLVDVRSRHQRADRATRVPGRARAALRVQRPRPPRRPPRRPTRSGGSSTTPPAG